MIVGHILLFQKTILTAHYFNRACRRGYVIATKDEKEPEDPGKVVYTLGTRFAVDLGRKRLMRAYFATLGQDMDQMKRWEIDCKEMGQLTASEERGK